VFVVIYLVTLTADNYVQDIERDENFDIEEL
jgi:hypothetical protein